MDSFWNFSKYSSRITFRENNKNFIWEFLNESCHTFLLEPLQEFLRKALSIFVHELIQILLKNFRKKCCVWIEFRFSKCFPNAISTNISFRNLNSRTGNLMWLSIHSSCSISYYITFRRNESFGEPAEKPAFSKMRDSGVLFDLLHINF